MFNICVTYSAVKKKLKKLLLLLTVYILYIKHNLKIGAID